MRHTSILFLYAAAIVVASDSVFGQTTWFKYEGNPVMSCGPAGTWDAYMVAPNRVIFEDTIFRMWYTGGDGSQWRTGIATSRDGAHWTKSAQNPVLDVGPASWNAAASYEGYVVKVDGGYKMWYTGLDASGMWKLGYASSPDGIAWAKGNGVNPVIGTGTWYARGPHNPSVLGPDNNGAYKMWFQGNPIAHALVQVGYAIATNETTWTVNADPAFSYGTAGSWDDDKVMNPKVLFDGQRYEMWYGGEQHDGITEIGYATSPDGLNWTRYAANPVMGRGPLDWDLADLYCLDVYFDAGMYHMWYGGRRPSGTTAILPIQGVGYAVSLKGMSYAVSTNGDSVLVVVCVPNAAGLSFSALIRDVSEPLNEMELADDGNHGDGLASDGVFANWCTMGSGTYYVDLTLKVDTLVFKMYDADTITTSSLSVLQKESEISSDYSLFQNFPNPFNPSTEIHFALPHRSHVTLTIFDLVGREVATLESEELSPGRHSTRWDAAGFPSGVYFYRLKAGNFVETKKLVLLR